jgi:hypothetical protein
MSARPFTAGPYCRDCRNGNTRHRRRCRDTGTNGETFRDGLARVGLALPVVADGEPAHKFPCPFGYGWDWAPGAEPPRPAGSRSLPILFRPEVIEERRALCQACGHRDGNVCMLVKAANPGKAGLIEVGLKLSQARCPVNKWDRWPAIRTPSETTARPE